MIRHIVFFTLKNPSEMADIVGRLKRLGTIPGSTLFEVIANTKVDNFGNEIDIVVYAEFPDIAALKAYKKHPVYAEVTADVRPRRELRFAADILTAFGEAANCGSPEAALASGEASR